MDSLFSQNKQVPLAHAVRPKNWSEFVGQTQVVQSLKSIPKPTSILFYGPPGSGKTTLAHLLTQSWSLEKRYLSCVTSGLKEVREVLDEAKRRGTIVLFLDEIHRFSSSQQDALLSAVEEGEIILIAATTENPSFRVNKALLSRMLVYRLTSLSEAEENYIFESCLTKLNHKQTFPEDLKKELFRRSSGDARKLLGYLERILNATNDTEKITESKLAEILGENVIFYDKNSESHYDIISAFIKSLRGSDPDAAIFYLALMIEGGEDPLFIARRLVIFASEDIGNASVHALPLAIATWQAVERVGMPEGRIPLSQCTTFLASAPKSNASYLAIDKALQMVRERKREFQIPNHLRNAPTATHKNEGAGKDYQYPHDFPDHFVREKYFPDSFYPNPPEFYEPTNQGMEKNLKDQLRKHWGDKK
ncbi:replication-associated recombination protein A [Leptospira terpstrae]|uniref:Replication-associated recombination protein A n=1 Tax=Leptospira terpstrae serovar Hualin str. LT 11-33 = ATCC 700639 TaxID=1257025 RepID=N1VXR3_9LEPT|nr:replication-associated recombination protein A [Leptospira terpstrae]EMY61567.1 MgsA AAA+ ATPase family protein [Leptospira terpstrae serovar Hualin str. LT 11-33 = ATCC 700639]